MAILLLRLFLPPLISPLALWSRTLTEALHLLSHRLLTGFLNHGLGSSLRTTPILICWTRGRFWAMLPHGQRPFEPVFSLKASNRENVLPPVHGKTRAVPRPVANNQKDQVTAPRDS